MTLPFSETLNDKSTYFPYLIWKSRLKPAPIEQPINLIDYMDGYHTMFGRDWEVPPLHQAAKDHTIRKDLSNRWKRGNKIHFVVNNRQPTRYQFAPVVLCTSVEPITITWNRGLKSVAGISEEKCEVRINGQFYGRCWRRSNAEKVQGCSISLETLAKRDGFPTIEDFLAYFSEDFAGKIIHWTDRIYGYA